MERGVDRRMDQELERLTRSYGQELFARVERRGPVLFTPGWWDERLMGWTMGDEAVKLQLFRFIDVLPLLNGPETVTRHLREYFEEARAGLPGWANVGVRWLPRQGLGARLLAHTARGNAERLARRFIAGSNIDEVLGTVARLRRRRLAFTVDLLGEATITETEAVRCQESYLHLIEGLCGTVNAWPAVRRIDQDSAGPLPRVNVSIKLSALYSQFDPIDPTGTSAAVRNRLRPILHSARVHGAFVNIDMEQHAFKDLTLHVFKEILEEAEFRDWPDVGIALQAYLRSCERDLGELAAWARRRGTPVWVRLIKGAYWDYETVIAAQEGWPTPVFEKKWQTDANFERLTLLLLEHRDVLRPAFGSHNIRSLAHAMAAAQLRDLPQDSYEIQMLYGMADPIKEALVNLGRRVRVYTPYGQLLPGMAYLVRRLLENTANDSFLRASFTEHVAEEKLLMNPVKMQTQNGEPRTENREASAFSKEPGRDGLASFSVLGSPFSVHSFKNEPVTDFSQEQSRAAMQAALVEVKKQLGHKYPVVIGGRAMETTGTIDSVNPSHIREMVGQCGRGTAEQARDAVSAAATAFPGWRDTPVDERANYLVRAAAAMRRRRFELAAWEVYECAKQWREADADVAEAIDFCEFYAQVMRRLAQPRGVTLPGEVNAFTYEPRGVTVVIAPWNFPLAILCGMSAAALVTGNTIVMKPAEQSSVVGAKLMEVWSEIGLPPGVVNYLAGVGEEVGPALVDDPRTALVAFTGSRNVGMLLAKQTAQLMPGQDHIKSLISELGGKNAIIIDDDADLDEAVSGVVASAYGYQGQKCSACSRVIVLEDLHDVFLERLIAAVSSLKIAPAEDPGSRIGPVIDEEARQRILGYIEKGKREARLAYAGDLVFLINEGYYVAPHIFADVKPDAVIAQEEIFGPVLAVLKAKDLDEALRVANGTQYALTGGVYSRSPEHIERVKREFRVGNLYVNRKITGALVGRQPFGGFKLSGIGSQAGGADYLLQFLLPRTITENTMRRGFAPVVE
jgi:RHH-type proline utilization regulon transcriptional repressor/proline dehydrogenase/delta 1-pyrroline-5-carboxylate dehydrogenase